MTTQQEGADETRAESTGAGTGAVMKSEDAKSPAS
jgi:hypothetical protein